MQNKSIAWLSRHAPTEDQIAALHAAGFTGGVVQISATFVDANDAWQQMLVANGGDLPSAVVAVLPPPIEAEFWRLCAIAEIPLLKAIMQRTLHDDGTATFAFNHFERVLAVQYVSVPL